MNEQPDVTVANRTGAIGAYMLDGKVRIYAASRERYGMAPALDLAELDELIGGLQDLRIVMRRRAKGAA